MASMKSCLVAATLLLSGQIASGTHLEEIEASLAPAYQALPKNSLARIESSQTRYLARRYFSSSRGWTVASLLEDTPGGDSLVGHLQKAMEEKRSHRGLSLSDVAQLVMQVEAGLQPRFAAALEASFEIAGVTNDGHLLDIESAKSVLAAYLATLLGQSRESTRMKGDLDSLVDHIVDEQVFSDEAGKATLLDTTALGQMAELLLQGVPSWKQEQCNTALRAGSEVPECWTLDEEVSFCCPNTCDAVVASLESTTQGPLTTAFDMWQLLHQGYFFSPRPGSLEETADIQLHGPVAVEILAATRPAECSRESASQALQGAGVSPNEQQVELARSLAEEISKLGQDGTSLFNLRSGLRCIVMVILVLATLQALWKAWSKAMDSEAQGEKKQKATAARGSSLKPKKVE